MGLASLIATAFLAMGPPSSEALAAMPDRGFSVILADSKEALLSGAVVKNASVINDVIGQPALLIEFTPEGAAKLDAAAKAHPGATITVLVASKPAAPSAALSQGASGQMIVREVGDQAEDLAATLRALPKP